MTLVARLLVISCALFGSACINAALVLHVSADGSGRAVVTSQVYVAGIQALDSLFPSNGPKTAPKLIELLPEPSAGSVERAFGTPVRLLSSTLGTTPDGGVRRTIVEFDDISRVRLTFPSELSMPGSGYFGSSVVGDAPVFTFSRRRDPNGDELLVVKMPDPPVVHEDPGHEPITKFETDSAEERALKLAIKRMRLNLTVEVDQPLLRTNAPKSTESGAAILDLDMDRMVNAMDETKARRMIDANSFQEILWQLGDLPGAAVPVDHEVFLEYQPPPRQAPAPSQPAVQAPPDTEIYLLPMTIADGTITLGAPADITNSPGYDNQPFFTADSRSILFTSIRGGSAQTDIYRYDIATAQTTQVTSTPESEYSPTVTPSGALSVIRVEADGTQRLWQFTADRRDPRVILPAVKPVGYHAWADDHTVALFVLGSTSGAPATLQLADTRTGTSVTVATDIGRSIQTIPGRAHTISFVQRERGSGAPLLVIKELDPATRAISTLAPAVAGSTEADTAWTPEGTLLMAHAGVLYSWRRGQSGWNEVASLERMGLRGVTRLAVSPRGNYLAVVASPQTSR
jgi:WD40-like Beta Propeller Repeat